MKWPWGQQRKQQERRSSLLYRPLCLEVEELEPRLALSPLTPVQTRRAYGFDQVVFTANGQTIRGDGSGQTIAIVVAYGHANVAQDVDTFSRSFTLGGSRTLYQDYGPASSFLTIATPQGTPQTDPNGLWALETVLDVQWAHAIAPAADILLVQTQTSSFADLMGGVEYARHQSGVSVVSLSWGTREFAGEKSWDVTFTTPEGHLGGSDGRGGPRLTGGVTFVAASGDSGTPGLWPAVSKNVVAVGGTTLTIDSAGNYGGEVAWSGSGGGRSEYLKKPFYQENLPFKAKRRLGPDVAYNANPGTGFYVYDSLPVNGRTGWWSVGGTSIAAPQWAALVAIANQGRALAGLGSLDGPSQTLPALYQLPANAFHDITSGSNGLNTRIGFDLVTGRGSPYANQVIQGLAAYRGSSGPFTSLSAPTASQAPALEPASMIRRRSDPSGLAGSVTWDISFLGIRKWERSDSRPAWTRVAAKQLQPGPTLVMHPVTREAEPVAQADPDPAACFLDDAWESLVDWQAPL